MSEIINGWIGYSLDFFSDLSSFLTSPRVFLIVVLFIFVYIAGQVKKLL